MRKILSLAAAFLFSANIFAADSVTAANSALRNFDLIGPAISFTPLAQSSCVTSRNFTATITDIDGVNTTLGTRPRVYYQRVGDGNILINNTNVTLGWKYAEATNTSSPFNFVIDYSLLNGGVTSGQTIQYFVVAEDLEATPNVGSGLTTFSAPPSSVVLTATAFPAGGAIPIYSIVNALPTFLQIGSSADFSTLTTAGGLFSAINNVGLSGNTTVEIVDSLITESNAFPLYQVVNTGCGSGTVTLTIKPAAGISPIVTGSRSFEPIIRILSSNVTIDGSNNGTASRNLTFRNTNIISPNVILFGSLSTVAVSNSTLKNTVCINGINLTSCIVLSDGSVGGNPGYFNDIAIQNNNVQKSSIGILCAAVSAVGNGTNVLITGNDLNANSPNQIGLLGIYAEGLDAAVISNNNLGNFEPAFTGPRYGIQLAPNTKNTTVSGNIISAISFTGTTPQSVYGIFLNTGLVASNNTITGNTISNITSSGSATVFGINVTTASGGITIQQNNISNIKNTNGAGYGAYGIGLSSTSTTSNITVANNFIFDIAGFGLSTIARNGYGIYLSAGGGYRIYYNSINMNTNQTNVTGPPAALMINGVTTASSLDIRNNIFANTQTGGATARYAVYSVNANTIFSNIDNNDYYSTGPNLGFISATVRATLGDIQTGFGSNLNSLNVLPNFVSSTDLHLTTANCGLDGKATPLTVTTDIDATTRDVTTPDIGADEFTAVNSNTLAGIVAAAVCENKAVSVTGTTYVTAACDLIARVLPAGGGTAVSGPINTCVTRNATQQYFNGEPYVQRHYDIEPVSNAATATATVTLYFTNQEFVDYNTINGATWPPLPTAILGNGDPARANVRVTQFHGTPTGGLPTTTPGNYTGTRVLINPVDTDVFWSGFYWQVTIPVTGFSGFYLHSTLYNTPLPIVVNYLTGRRQGSNHLLNWKVTCTTSPRANITLQRSSDSRNFNDIYSITADALRCNQPFDYTDANPLKGMNYYRLKIVDADGKITYSTTVALLNAAKGFDIISIAPNPVVNDNFKLNVSNALSGKMEIVIFDMQGRLVNRQSISLIAGFNSLPVNVANLSAGTYTIKAGMADEQTKIVRFVKQ